MKKLILINLCFFTTALSLYAQIGQKVVPVTLKTVSGDQKNIPYIGQKAFLLIYTDPDIQKFGDKLSEILYKQNYDMTKVGSVGVVNAKETWIPETIMIPFIKKEQKKYPPSVFLIDENRILQKAWHLSNGNGAMIIIIIDKHGIIRYYKIIKSQEEATAITPNLLHTINNMLKENKYF